MYEKKMKKQHFSKIIAEKFVRLRGKDYLCISKTDN